MTSWMLVSNDDFAVDANVSVARRMYKPTSQGIYGSDDLAGELDDIDDFLLLPLTKFHVVLVTSESSAKDNGGTALSTQPLLIRCQPVHYPIATHFAGPPIGLIENSCSRCIRRAYEHGSEECEAEFDLEGNMLVKCMVCANSRADCVSVS